MTRTHLALLAFAFCAQTASGQESLEDLLNAGRLSDAERLVNQNLQETPDDPLLITKRGVVDLLKAVERLGQANYRYGSGRRRAWAPFFRLGVVENPNPESVGYQDVRVVLQGLIDDLARVEATLARVGDRPVKWDLDLAQLRVDLNQDGEASLNESLGKIYANLSGLDRRRRGEEQDEALSFRIGLDTGDVYWLRGYCHVLSALAETLLAYDQQRLFDHTAHLIFPKAKIKHEYLAYRPEERSRGFWEWRELLDGVAMIHLMDWPLREQERLQAAHTHLLGMIETSRAGWRVILAEEDNDHEWIPNPNQESVLPRGALTEQQIETWHNFLAEAESLLEGKKLAPFWRDPKYGINLKRVFYEPSDFDLILWIQGSAAAAYLEEGPQTQTETWTTFQRVFRGQFLGFAFWIN